MTNITYYRKDNRMGFERKGARGEFSAEASTLFGPGQVPSEFNLTIQASGNTRRFEGAYIKRDREGDVTEFVYRSPDGFVFRVFND